MSNGTGNGEDHVNFTSTDIDQLAAALAAAQATMPAATFNKVNPHFKSKYADLAAVRAASLPHLAAHGLAIVQFTRYNSTSLMLHTRLVHKSGQWIEGVYPIKTGAPQAMGSELTYARRYGWSSMLGMAADEDDDANAASEETTITPEQAMEIEVLLNSAGMTTAEKRQKFLDWQGVSNLLELRAERYTQITQALEAKASKLREERHGDTTKS